MKNKKLAIILTVVIILIVLAIVFIIGFGKRTKVENKSGEFDFSTNEIKNVKLNTGIVIEKGKIEKADDHYRIYLKSINNTKKTVDMGKYRIAFLDANNEEIEFFRGTIIGLLQPGETSESIIESYQDLSKLKSISYEEFPYED